MSFIAFPALSSAASPATLLRWLKQSGDSFEVGEGLVELEAEESLVLVEATVAGSLIEVIVQPGQTVEANAKLARYAPKASVQTPQSHSALTEKSVSEQPSPSAGGKVTPILMPQAGNTMEEGTVIAWRVKEGEQISVGQILCEIETDKATMNFESPDAGRIARLIAKLGEPVAVKEPIALLADSDADAEAYLACQGTAVVAVTAITAPSSSTTSNSGSASRQSVARSAVTAEGRVKASPAARKLAAERGIELSAVGVGSGPGERILSADLKNIDVAASTGSGAELRKPLSKMRRAIGLNLQQSKQTVPHFYVRLSIDADPLLAFYRAQKAVTNCSLNDVIVFALGRAIREFPAVRSQIVGNEIVEYPHANIGIAVGIDAGLVVPVVTDVDTLSLAKLAVETKRVVELARKGRLENIGKGHFTVSNLGMFGVEEFSAIINPPESGILAVSAAREAVIVENGAMRAGRSMTMTLSADHRIVDGVMAAKFMQRLKAILENPVGEFGWACQITTKSW